MRRVKGIRGPADPSLVATVDQSVHMVSLFLAARAAAALADRR
jgi:hypothetical protein